VGPGRAGGRADRGQSGGDRGRGGRPEPRARGRERDPGEFDNSERRGGSRLAPKSVRLPDPAIPADVTGKELDRAVHHQLRTLSKENADGVAKHLVMVAALLAAEDLDGALAHAETAVRRAGRVPAAREALGMVAYSMGDFARALGEFRTVKRLSGSGHLLPLMVDCERGLGRYERALDLAASPEVGSLDIEDRVELAIVVSGIRRDLGQLDAAAVALQIPATRLARRQPWAARLFYAQAEVELARGDTESARALFSKALDADQELMTDAGDRLAELDGVVIDWSDE
jgi:tetratricopeptide (TPR) repeat protein